MFLKSFLWITRASYIISFGFFTFQYINIGHGVVALDLPDVHRDVLPLYYRPIIIFCSLTILSIIFRFLNFLSLNSIFLASTLLANFCLKTRTRGRCPTKDFVLPELCS